MLKTSFTKAAIFLLAAAFSVAAQENQKSIGGKEHDMNIYGVQIGMDVPTALQTVFENANRQPGQEKPDAMKTEGKDKKDIRVVYKALPDGELQLVFAEGKFVKQMILLYANVKRVDELRLPNSSDIGEVNSGARFDDRYTIGFVDNKKQEKLWWRDEKNDRGVKVRLTFLSGNLTKDTTNWWQTVVRKTILIEPAEEANFSQVYKK